MRVDFFEIGTCTYDAFVFDAVRHPALVGVSVDAVQEFLDRCPSPPHVRKVCTAVGAFDGVTEFHLVRGDAVARVLKRPPRPNSAQSREGRSALTHRAELERMAAKAGLPYEALVDVRQVPIRTLGTLVQELGVTQIDRFKVDAEGTDGLIMGQMAALMQARAVSVRWLKFEHHTVPAAAYDALVRRYALLGYRAMRGRADTVLERQ